MTRYYSYHEYDPESELADVNGGYIVTMSEDDIREQYWPYWYGRMCEKFGEVVDGLYSFEDCLDDWIEIHQAWEVKD